jgi:hypothetical protein
LLEASQLQTALAGYMDEIHMVLEREEADPRVSFSIRIEHGGVTSEASTGRSESCDPRVFPEDAAEAD